MKIEIRMGVKPRAMRYPSAGDYVESGDKVTFYIIELADWRHCALLLMHEMVEYFLVKACKIKVSDIDAFDIQFEIEREMGIHSDDDEPGDDRLAPYVAQHCLASAVERLMAPLMGVSYSDYNRALSGVIYPKIKNVKKTR